MTDVHRTIPEEYETLFEKPNRLAFKIRMGEEGYILDEDNCKPVAAELSRIENDLGDMEAVITQAESLKQSFEYLESKRDNTHSTLLRIAGMLGDGTTTEALLDGLKYISDGVDRLMDEVVVPAVWFTPEET